MSDVCETKRRSAAAVCYAKKMLDPDFYVAERERLKVLRNKRYAEDEEYRARYKQKALEYYYRTKTAKMTVIQ
eukprot:767541-Hanusia_phi.AAC.2